MPLIQFGPLSLDYEPRTENMDAVLIFRGPPGGIIAVNVWQMSASGPHNYLSAPQMMLDAAGEHRFRLLGKWPDGLYMALLEGGDSPSNNFDPTAARPFRIENGEAVIPLDGPAAVGAALDTQRAFRDHEIRADGFDGDNRLTLHVLVEGCQLDYSQPFEGGRLQPLPTTLGPESVVTALNTVFRFTLANTELREQYGRAHPLCLISFVNVQAPDLAQAVAAVRRRLERLLGVLAEERSATPEVLAYVTENAAGDRLVSVQMATYRGNLIPGFGPGVTGLLELVGAAATADPWIDFALGLMRSTRLQTNPEVQLFQSWSLIEAAAKRAVARDAAHQILDDNGATIPYRNSVLTQGHDLGRVIVYLRDHIGQNRFMWSALPGSPDFYAAVQQLYGARNRIAHEGGLTVPGADPIAGSVFEIAFIAKECASEVLQHEIRRAGAPSSS